MSHTVNDQVSHMIYTVWRSDPSNNQKISDKNHSWFPLQFCWRSNAELFYFLCWV